MKLDYEHFSKLLDDVAGIHPEQFTWPAPAEIKTDLPLAPDFDAKALLPLRWPTLSLTKQTACYVRLTISPPP
ncbi:MAG: hypothetical protein V9E91_00900 [Burkholderiaceae bacterium]